MKSLRCVGPWLIVSDFRSGSSQSTTYSTCPNWRKACLCLNEVITEENAWIDPDFSLIEHLMRVLEWKERKTRRHTVKMYKIQWSHHTEEEATWETEEYLNTKYPGFLQSRNCKFFYLPCLSWIESRDDIPFKGGRLWHPRFLINLNCWSTQLTVVKLWSTWAITSKTSLTLTLKHLRQANTSPIGQNPS
jgi:hypothetical protein